MQQNNRNNYHFEHIQAQILIILNETLKEEIYDEIVKLASFTDVKLSNDYSQCKVYVDTFDRKKINLVVKALNKAKGCFRTMLAKKLTIRKVPSLIFVNDISIDESSKIEKIINDLHIK